MRHCVSPAYFWTPSWAGILPPRLECETLSALPGGRGCLPPATGTQGAGRARPTVCYRWRIFSACAWTMRVKSSCATSGEAETV